MKTLRVASNLMNSVGAWRRVPLTMTMDDAPSFEGPGMFIVYVPSKYGGLLWVQCDQAGAEIVVRYPKPDSAPLKDLAGKEIPKGNPFFYTVAPGEYKWFYVFVGKTSGSYKVMAAFAEIGQARESKSLDAEPLVPWNFWYFPNAASRKEFTAWGSSKITPCQKYEQAFKVTGVFDWEKANHNDPTGTAQSWEGHCHNSAPASMMFKEPPPEGKEFNSVKFSAEELKFFATEFVGRYNVAQFKWGLPGHGSMGRQGFEQEHLCSDDPARFGKVIGDFHNALRAALLDEMVPVMMDLRDSAGGSHPEVWNQAIYRYQAWMYEVPGNGDWTDLMIQNDLNANEDLMMPDFSSSGLPGTIVADGPKADGKPKRVEPNPKDRARNEILIYRLVFLEDGTVAVKDKRNAWYSVQMTGKTSNETFAPRFMFSYGRAPAAPAADADGNPKLGRDEILKLIELRDSYK